jgi:hypothetical protein
MTMTLALALLLIAALVVGATFGGLAVWWQLRRQQQDALPSAPTADPWTAAAIDQAATDWAMQRGMPEAAPLLAGKLHLLHRLGAERGNP